MAHPTQYIVLFILLAATIIHSFPQNNRKHSYDDQIDHVPAATGHGHGHHHGRVQIKVYRGQSKQHGYEHFAPYGYWVRQPPDNHGHHGHGY